MTHEELIQSVAQQLDWSDVATTEALDAIISVLKAELTANNPIDLDDFGKFSTPKQPEYILTDRITNDRYLMPPAVGVLFESSAALFFTPEDSLNESVNGAFSFFEPTQLHEGVALPDVPEVIVGGEEKTEEEAVSETAEAERETEITENQEGETEAETGETAGAEKDEKIEAEAEKEIAPEVKLVRDHGPYRRKARRRKKSPLWIPIAGGVAIALAALFFFRVGQPEKNESTVALPQGPEAEMLSASRSDMWRSEAKAYHDGFSGTLPDTTEANTLHREVKNETSLPEVKKIRLVDGKTLRLLAEDLFGNREFWVYIYLENKSLINNPNRVAAGTELIVPDRTKYDINATDPVSVARAKNQGNKILER